MYICIYIHTYISCLLSKATTIYKYILYIVYLRPIYRGLLRMRQKRPNNQAKETQ
jgi:hypothetical protein